jgi:hypothetical protein
VVDQADMGHEGLWFQYGISTNRDWTPTDESCKRCPLTMADL